MDCICDYISISSHNISNIYTRNASPSGLDYRDEDDVAELYVPLSSEAAKIYAPRYQSKDLPECCFG